MLGTTAFAFVAGVLSILSPCVLPLLPIVLGAAVCEHRFGPAALSGGVALSFTIIGLFIATIGFAIGLDGDVLRSASAVLLIAIGIILLVPAAQVRFALAASPAATWTETRFAGFSPRGWQGQFGVGLLLGAVWSPCVGPTLGAASLAAARAEHLGAVAATMFAFGVGAALPLLLLGLVSREALLRWRGGLRATGGLLKQVLGAGLVVAGLLIVTGLDRHVETALNDHSPAWLTELTTRF